METDKNQASAEHKAVVEFLRGKNGPKVRRGVLNGKRVDYFKGKLLFLSREVEMGLDLNNRGWNWGSQRIKISGGS